MKDASDSPSDIPLTPESTFALATLLHHYWYTSYGQHRIKQAELGREFGFEKGTEINNFLRQGAEGKGTGAAQKIAAKLRQIYLEKREIDNAPDHIRRACYAAFPEDEDTKRLLRGDVGSIFADCTASTLSENEDALDREYDGIYNVYRYAARVVPSERPEKFTDESGNISYVSNVLHAGLRIYAREDGQKFPRFELHYKPSPKTEQRPPRTSRGSVILIDDYMHFIGREDAFHRPLYMVCKFDPFSAADFSGIVVRHHDGGGELFASRAYYRKNKEVKDIKELHDDLGVLSENDLPEDIKQKATRFMNDTDYGGKGALLIRG